MNKLDLIRYLYGDDPPDDAARRLEADADLRAEIEELDEVKALLDARPPRRPSTAALEAVFAAASQAAGTPEPAPPPVSRRADRAPIPRRRLRLATIGVGSLGLAAAVVLTFSIWLNPADDSLAPAAQSETLASADDLAAREAAPGIPADPMLAEAEQLDGRADAREEAGFADEVGAAAVPADQDAAAGEPIAQAAAPVERRALRSNEAQEKNRAAAPARASRQTLDALDARDAPASAGARSFAEAEEESVDPHTEALGAAGRLRSLAERSVGQSLAEEVASLAEEGAVSNKATVAASEVAEDIEGDVPGGKGEAVGDDALANGAFANGVRALPGWDATDELYLIRWRVASLEQHLQGTQWRPAVPLEGPLLEDGSPRLQGIEAASDRRPPPD